MFYFGVSEHLSTLKPMRLSADILNLPSQMRPWILINNTPQHCLPFRSSALVVTFFKLALVVARVAVGMMMIVTLMVVALMVVPIMVTTVFLVIAVLLVVVAALRVVALLVIVTVVTTEAFVVMTTVRLATAVMAPGASSSGDHILFCINEDGSSSGPGFFSEGEVDESGHQGND